jgi:hypothetical protein
MFVSVRDEREWSFDLTRGFHELKEVTLLEYDVIQESES